MTWSAPEGPVERIPAPAVGASSAAEAREPRNDTPAPGAADAAPPLFSTPNYPESGYSDPGYQESGYSEPGHQESGYSEPSYGDPAYPDPRYPTNSQGASGYGQGYAHAGQAAPAQHLAYPVTPYVPAPYTAPRGPAAGSLTLSIVALCLSGGSFFVALIPVLQFVWWMVGIAGIVCGFIALRREPRGRAMAITAIVLGFISVFGLLLLIVLALLFFGGIGLLGGLSSY